MKKKKILVIVESPSKCKKIESYLNNFYKDYDFKCMASVGHIKNLPRKKLGTYEELLPLIGLLSSKEASMMNGCCVPIDGGASLNYDGITF